jgi:signal transduction histidine kinase
MIRLSIKDYDGSIREMETGEPLLHIGRSPDGSVKLKSPEAEWQHGQIFQRDGKIWYRDLNSDSGTILVTAEGRREIKRSMHEVRLKAGDSIELGGCKIVLVSVTDDPYSIVGGDNPFIQGKSSGDVQDLIRRLEKDHRVLELIYRFEKRLSGVFDLEDILETISEAVLSVFEKATHLFVAFVDGDRIDLAFTRCRDRGEAAAGPVSLSRFIVKQVTETGEATSFCLAEGGGLELRRTEKLEVDPTMSVRLNRIQSGICAPLWSGSSVIGVLEIDNRIEISAFTDRERDLLVLFANRAAMALEKHQRYMKDLQQTRDAAIGQVVNKVVHDLANHYTVLLPMTDMAEEAIQYLESEAVGGDPNPRKVLQNVAKLRECWHKIDRHQEMVVGLIDDLRHFAKERKPEYRAIPATELIEESIDMARFRALDRKKNVTFQIEGESAKLSVFGDKRGIRRVLQNLMNNSVDAVNPRSKGRVTISVRRIEEDGRRYVRISVRDTGCGIPPDLVDKIFQYGFTTKPGVSGSGFGLSIISKVIAEHKGFVRIASEKDHGTEFQVHFPEIKRVGQIEEFPDRQDRLVETFAWI